MLNAKPYWKTFNSDDYSNSLLIPDEVVLTHGWSGSVAIAYWETYDEETEDGNWYYAIPKEGAVKWLDNICITADSERYETAMHFVNYLLEPEVAGTITNYVYYSSPNTAASEFMSRKFWKTPLTRLKVMTTQRAAESHPFLTDEMWTRLRLVCALDHLEIGLAYRSK